MVPRIHCAVCNKTVDHVEMWRDEPADRLIFRVQCHGATDRCEVNQSFILQHGPQALNQGVAFTSQAQELIKAE
jgi:hypothetical protein